MYLVGFFGYRMSYLVFNMAPRNTNPLLLPHVTETNIHCALIPSNLIPSNLIPSNLTPKRLCGALKTEGRMQRVLVKKEKCDLSKIVLEAEVIIYFPNSGKRNRSAYERTYVRAINV